MFLIFQWSTSVVQEGQSDKEHISSLIYLLKTEELFSPRIIKCYWRGHKHAQVLQREQNLPLLGTRWQHPACWPILLFCLLHFVPPLSIHHLNAYVTLLSRPTNWLLMSSHLCIISTPPVSASSQFHLQKTIFPPFEKKPQFCQQSSWKN